MVATGVPLQVNPRQVLAELGYDLRAEPMAVTGGWDTLLWRFETLDGASHTLRIHYLPRREEMAFRERIALEACAVARIPAPRVEHIATFGELPLLVLSWCPGEPLLSLLERHPWDVWRMARAFGRTQARIHAVPAPEEFAAGAPDDWVRRAAGEYAPIAEYVAARRPSAARLVHLDYHPLNVIARGTRVTGVIDWTYAAAGDPRADLARTAFTVLAAPLPPGRLSGVMNLLRKLMLRGWRRGYEELAGPMPDYRPFMAWAGASLLGEIELVVDKPQVWGTAADVERLREMTRAWWARTAR